MAAPSPINSVPKLYMTVVDDVISNIREAFLDDGVDESVLEELKNLWLGKLKASKALENPPPSKAENFISAEYFQKIQSQQTMALNRNSQNNIHAIQPVHLPIQITSNRDLSNSAATATMSLPAGLFQQQFLAQGIQIANTGQFITVPAIPGSNPANVHGSNTVQIINPNMKFNSSSAVKPTQLAQSGQSGSIVQTDGANDQPIRDRSQTSRNPSTIACQNAESYFEPTDICRISQHRGCACPKQTCSQTVVIQVDGAQDTSSDEDDDDEEVNDEDDQIDDMESEGITEEPLNSGDDISEADPAELFDTENVVVCQFDRINRNKNRWKFQLKDGIMNLNGRDFVFHRATGDAEW